MLSYLINVALLIALLACTTYMYFVNQRLRLLRSGQDDIGPMVEKFAAITGEMTQNLSSLKNDALATARQLEEIITHAHDINQRIEKTLLDVKGTEKRIEARSDSLKREMAAHRVEPGRRPEEIDGLGELLKAFEAEIAAKAEEAGAGQPARKPLPSADMDEPEAGIRPFLPRAAAEGEKQVRQWAPSPAAQAAVPTAAKKNLMDEAIGLFYDGPAHSPRRA